MSFILKALRKVEEEKGARRSKPQDINRAILTTGTAPPRTSRLLPAAAVIGLIVLAGGALAYLMWPADSGPLRQPAPAAPPRESRAPESRPPSADSPHTPPAAGNVTAPAPSVTAAGPPGKPPRVEEGRHGETAPSAGKPAPAAGGPRSERTGREQTYGPQPGLKVNGIALQDNPAESVAVVNGQLVRRGMVIQGMKVEEILADRVRFSGSGGNCEVTISK